jgi:hypothetical protein
MNPVVSSLVSLVWGQAATELFFRGWISFLGAMGCLIFAFHPGACRPALAVLSWHRVTESFFYGLALVFGFFLLYVRWNLGNTALEVLVFWVSASVRLVFVLYRISPALDRMLDEARRARDRNR